jgi:hypothetical protein
MLQIAPEKVALVIVRAREFDADVESWDDEAASDDRQDGSDAAPALRSTDPVVTELTAFIDGLNVDEQVDLVALMWVGRGTFEPEDFAEAVETAQNERVNKTSAYLLGIPLLADYLEEGLDKMGYSIEDAEKDVL